MINTECIHNSKGRLQPDLPLSILETYLPHLGGHLFQVATVATADCASAHAAARRTVPGVAAADVCIQTGATAR